MHRVCHLLQAENQYKTNIVALAQPNPTPHDPPPMVLQNPLPNQGMVATQPLVQQNTTNTSLSEPIDNGVHHLMTLSSDFKLQTRCNQYGCTTETINPSIESTSTTLDMSLHLSRPSTNGTAKVPRFPLHRVVTNPTTRATLNVRVHPYIINIIDNIFIYL